jgi:hypothetical protein
MSLKYEPDCSPVDNLGVWYKLQYRLGGTHASALERGRKEGGPSIDRTKTGRSKEGWTGGRRGDMKERRVEGLF